MALKFTRKLIAAESFESAGVFDVNGDGVLDIVSGAYWYEGPHFVKRHYIGEIKRYGEYFDDFSTIHLDIDGDGRPDYVTGGWWGGNLRWRQNPGNPDQEWKEHIIADVGNVETTRAWDVDGDGELEIVPNTPGHPLAFYKLIKDANGKGTGAFSKHAVTTAGGHGHGLGFGDINGDGRGDFIVKDGWIEAPADPLTGTWIHHHEFDLGSASVPIIVADVNGDGLNDLIVGQAHGYGLDWWEQRIEAGKRRWIKHPIDPFNSQYHDMQWVDIDGDGKPELVTGKRFRAHNDNDAGAHDDVGIYYFKWNGESFSKQVIAHGPFGGGSTGGAGCGIHFAVADLRGSGRLDIIAPGKDGLKVFFNEGHA
ncbi:MAG: VCBS repeat-containing protein [Planctomycetes bacterium]|nr:VCBS repeat-containing protein [Planctomycetota bacterium]